jgi:hypothetical protein
MTQHDARDYNEHHFFAQGRMWVPETDLNEAQAEIRRLRAALRICFSDWAHPPRSANEKCLFCGEYDCPDGCPSRPLMAEFAPARPKAR